MQKIETSYEFGKAIESFFDDCHNEELFLEGFTLSEAYHQLINYTARKKITKLKFLQSFLDEEIFGIFPT